MSLKVTVRYRNLSMETHQAASMAQVRRLVAAKQDFWVTMFRGATVEKAGEVIAEHDGQRWLRPEKGE
jgi:hypothetical protein